MKSLSVIWPITRLDIPPSTVEPLEVSIRGRRWSFSLPFFHRCIRMRDRARSPLSVYSKKENREKREREKEGKEERKEGRKKKTGEKTKKNPPLGPFGIRVSIAKGYHPDRNDQPPSPPPIHRISLSLSLSLPPCHVASMQNSRRWIPASHSGLVTHHPFPSSPFWLAGPAD